jgi:hypothetical protein
MLSQGRVRARVGARARGAPRLRPGPIGLTGRMG